MAVTTESYAGKIQRKLLKKQKVIEAASGRKKADLVLKNATFVNVFSNELTTCDIACANGLIVGLGEYDGDALIKPARTNAGDGKNLPMQLSAHWQKNGSILYLSFGEVMHNVKEHSSTAVSILCLVRPTPHLCRPTTASSETSISVRPMHI